MSTCQIPNPWLDIRLRWAALVGGTLHVLTNKRHPCVILSSELSLRVVLGTPITIIMKNVDFGRTSQLSDVTKSFFPFFLVTSSFLISGTWIRKGLCFIFNLSWFSPLLLFLPLPLANTGHSLTASVWQVPKCSFSVGCLVDFCSKNVGIYSVKNQGNYSFHFSFFWGHIVSPVLITCDIYLFFCFIYFWTKYGYPCSVLTCTVSSSTSPNFNLQLQPLTIYYTGGFFFFFGFLRCLFLRSLCFAGKTLGRVNS